MACDQFGFLERHKYSRRSWCPTLPIGQNIGKRNSAVKAAFGLFQKANRDRLGDCVACVDLLLNFIPVIILVGTPRWVLDVNQSAVKKISRYLVR